MAGLEPSSVSCDVTSSANEYPAGSPSALCSNRLENVDFLPGIVDAICGPRITFAGYFLLEMDNLLVAAFQRRFKLCEILK
jgi:hypothetical protein